MLYRISILPPSIIRSQIAAIGMIHGFSEGHEEIEGRVKMQIMIGSCQEAHSKAMSWIFMLQHLLSIIAVASLATSAWAVPEIARYGHFTCVSCHVSPSGGSTLTSYGRLFAAEKLSTWSFEGEENPLHGLTPVSDRILIGGDFRWVHLSRQDANSKFEKFWRMQSDIEPGLHLGNFWLTVTAGSKPAGPISTEKDANKLIARGYAVRFDLFDEHLIVRGGLFIPKFGLMLADHTAYVREIVDLGPDSEQTQFETIFQDDHLEFSLAAIVKNEMLGRQGKSKSGFNAGAGVMLGKGLRLNLNAMQTILNKKDIKQQLQAVGSSAVITFNKRLFSMQEVSYVQTSFETPELKSEAKHLASFVSLSLETIRGLIPYLRLEHRQKSEEEREQLDYRWGVGSNWYIRPHLQVDGRVLRQLDAKTKATQNTSSMIIHYYF